MAAAQREAANQSERLYRVLQEAAHIEQQLLEHEREESIDAQADREQNTARAMLERVTDGFLAVDGYFRLTYANQKAQEMLAPVVSPAGLIVGGNLWRALPQLKDSEIYRGLHRAAALRQSEQLEEYLPPINAWLEVCIYPSREGLSVYFRDVTGRKRAEVALRESEERFRQLFDQALDAVLIVDNHRRYIDANPAACRLLGLPRQHILSLSLDDFAGPRAGSALEATWDAFLKSGEDRGEWRLFLPDGSIRDVDYAAKANFVPGRHLSVLRDITERKRAARLRTAEHRATAVLAAAPDFEEAGPKLLQAIGESLEWPLAILWAIDDGTGLLRPLHYWQSLSLETPELERVFDAIAFLPGNGLPGRVFALGAQGWAVELASPADPLPHALRSYGAFDALAFPVCAGERVAAVLEFLYPRIDPLQPDLSQTLQSIASHIGQFIERQRAEKERAELLARAQAARAEAERASQSKDQFLAVMSHELRTPLTAILGYARLLRQKRLESSVVPVALETIERNAKLQSQLIEDLLDHSRIRAGKLRLELSPVDLSQVLSSATNAVHMAAEAKRIRMGAIHGMSPALVSGDPGRLQQVVSNLLNNAIKFTPDGGTVEVRLELSDSHAKIIVKDSGIGISPEFLPYVFDAFRQAEDTSRRSYGGLGLGLNLVRHLVEMHGGSVSAESPGDGQGAIFTVSLPLCQPSQAAPQPVGREVLAAVPVSLQGFRILAVDDHADTRLFLTTTLEQFGAHVTAVASAQSALEAMAECSPDVLLSDLAMPGEDGYALIRKVRAVASCSQLPAIALTAHAELAERARVLDAGYNMHLPKPVDPAVLATAIAIVAKGSQDRAAKAKGQ